MKKIKTITAHAHIKGLSDYSDIHGSISFKQLSNGVLVVSEIFNLPHHEYGNVFAFHIHDGISCDDSGNHFNPTNTIHPYHAGDMPPLFENNGYAYLSFFTNRFKVSDIIGNVVIIHENPDDFKSQPSGNPGKKIACGKIFYLN